MLPSNSIDPRFGARWGVCRSERDVETTGNIREMPAREISLERYNPTHLLKPCRRILLSNLFIPLVVFSTGYELERVYSLVFP